MKRTNCFLFVLLFAATGTYAQEEEEEERPRFLLSLAACNLVGLEYCAMHLFNFPHFKLVNCSFTFFVISSLYSS